MKKISPQIRWEKTAKGKVWLKAYYRGAKYKAYIKGAKYKAYRKAYMKAYHQTAKYKAYRKAYYLRKKLRNLLL